MQFNRGRGRTSPNELRRRVAVLHDEILELEGVLGGAAVDTDIAQPSASAVWRLRASIVHEELVRKRAEFETLSAEARAAGVDVDQAVADPLLRVDARSDMFSLPPPTSASRSRRQVMVLGAAGLLIIVLGLLVGRYTGLLGGAQTGQLTSTSTAAAPLAEPVEVAPLVASSPVTERGETFFAQEFEVTFSRGRMYLSGDPTPGSPFNVDDGMRLDVTRPDGSTATWSHDFNTGCIRNEAISAQDVTNVFQPGANRVSVTLYDICGASKGTTAQIWLVNRE